MAFTYFFLNSKNRPQRDTPRGQLNQTSLLHGVNVKKSSDLHLKQRQLLFLVSSKSAVITAGEVMCTYKTRTACMYRHIIMIQMCIAQTAMLSFHQGLINTLSGTFRSVRRVCFQACL
ncbi:hypothetical protein AMECASPLE_004853 [Ameca splendens]|uniref:Uncharacterized protein n=1 Tax=Ameca splendens TaxID=208324 RepID=A0ABV0ZUU9_9TELE